MVQKVTVRVPASTANLGPGFDCLGLALDIHNQITFQVIPQGLSVSVTGEGKNSIPDNDTNLVVRAAGRLFSKVNRRPNGLLIELINQIPVNSGLGSSASAVLGGIVAADAIVGSDLSKHELLKLAAEIEGHPDNVTPAMFGGLTLSFLVNERLVVKELRAPELQLVVVLPEFDLPTTRARAALPEKIPLSDAVFNLGRLGLLIHAFADGNFSDFLLAMEDRLHQPYRKKLIPGMDEAFTAGIEAGADGVALSGAGPAIIAIARSNHESIAQRMLSAFSDAGLPGRSWILGIDSDGCQTSAS